MEARNLARVGAAMQKSGINVIIPELVPEFTRTKVTWPQCGSYIHVEGCCTTGEGEKRVAFDFFFSWVWGKGGTTVVRGGERQGG